MTAEELEELLADCPTLYHMAERDSWPSIQEHGLLSTTALLDLYDVRGGDREQIESRRRGTSVSLESAELGQAIVRDQLPMDDRGLTRCLMDELTPQDWYRRLNSKVFFWLTRERLLRLLNAGTYRDAEHDVLELDSRSVVEAYGPKIWFCPINSGCTKPMPHPRGNDTFHRVSDYPYSQWKRKRKRGERVVELAVDYAVPDAATYVLRVVRMKRNNEIATLFQP